jgi:hypothetical protein
MAGGLTVDLDVSARTLIAGAGGISAGGQPVMDVATPTQASHAATKGYVDARTVVKFATGVGTTNAQGVLTIDFAATGFQFIPSVVATLGAYGASAGVLVDQITKTSARVLTYNVAGGGAIGNLPVQWQAISK